MLHGASLIIFELSPGHILERRHIFEMQFSHVLGVALYGRWDTESYVLKNYVTDN